MINPLGRRNTTVYDAAGRTVGSIDPLNRRATTVYNAASQTVASIDPTGTRTSTVYDAAGRPVATIDPLNQRTSTVYFADGQPKVSGGKGKGVGSLFLRVAGRYMSREVDVNELFGRKRLPIPCPPAAGRTAESRE